MEYRNIHDFLQFVFNVIAFRGRDIFEVDACEVLFQKLYCMNEFIFVFGVKNDRNRINVAKFLVQSRFAFHNRHGSSSSDIAKAQYAGAVGNNCYDIASPGHGQGQIFVVLNSKARSGNARCIYDSQIVAVVQFSIQFSLDHLMLFFSKLNGFLSKFLGIHKNPPE